MGILQAVSLVPARGDPVVATERLAQADMLNLIADYSLPRTIKEARERQEESAAYIATAEVIVKTYKEAVKVQEREEAASASESSKIKDLLENRAIKPVLAAAKYILKVSAQFIVRVSAVVFHSLLAVVRVVATLLMNPYVLAGLAVLGIAYAGYKYFTRDKKAPAESVTYVQVSPSAQSPAPVAPPQPKQGTSSEAPKALPAPPKQEAKADGPATTAKKTMAKTQISESVAAALQSASKRVDVPVNLLTAMAGVESSFNEGAKAPTTTASGMFQFINSTWDSVVKKYWKQYGYPERQPDRMRAEDSAILAAAMMKHEGYPAALKAAGTVSITDIYLTHFLGPGGGAAFIRKYQASPNVEAVNDTPASVVKANMSIYYRNGQAQTFKQIYDSFTQKLARYEAKTKDVMAATQPVTATPPAQQQTQQVAKQETAQPSAGQQQASNDYIYLPQGKGQPVVRAKA